MDEISKNAQAFTLDNSMPLLQFRQRAGSQKLSNTNVKSKVFLASFDVCVQCIESGYGTPDTHNRLAWTATPGNTAISGTIIDHSDRCVCITKCSIRGVFDSRGFSQNTACTWGFLLVL